MADRWKPTNFGKWMSKKYYRMIEKAMSSGRHEDLIKPDLTPKVEARLSGKLSHHRENTSISRYVWLPIEWHEDKPVIRWQDEWRL